MWVTQHGCEIHQLLKGRSNCFLVIKNNKALLVDTGRKNKRSILTDKIERQKNLTLVALILTHAHFDHAENAAFLKLKYSLPVFIHQNEAVYLTKGENPPLKGSIMVTELLTKIWESKIKSSFRYEPSEYDYTVDERLDLESFGFEAYLLHTPGHSPGSMSLIVDNEIAIVGDAMFGVFKKLIYPPFAYDPEQMIKSWGKLLDTGCRIFLPAHGTPNSRELIESQYEKFRKKNNN